MGDFHRRQGEMYAGGPTAPVVELLAEDIGWHVPGNNLIAGDYRGLTQVIDYFEKRRRLMNSTMRMRPGEVMCEGGLVAQFVEGSAMVGGEQVSWQTIGVYRVDVEQRRVHEAWLIPLDRELFDRIWSGSGGVTGLDHVQVAAPVGSEDAARQFYAGLLGLIELEKPEALRGRGGVWFACGAHQLHVGITPDFTPATKAHPALRVELSDLDRLAGQLTASSVDVQWDDAIPGVRRFYVADPWGNRIELIGAD